MHAALFRSWNKFRSDVLVMPSRTFSGVLVPAFCLDESDSPCLDESEGHPLFGCASAIYPCWSSVFVPPFVW